MQTTLSLPKPFLSRWILLLILLFILGIVTIYVMTNLDFENKNRRHNTENQENKGNGNSNKNLDIKIQKDKEMYQCGKHFNKHGRAMGYSSKKEYGEAALKFAETNTKNPNAQIYEGTWNARGVVERRVQQIAIQFENRTVIIDKFTGQLIDFYEGIDMRGLINILKLQ